MRRTNGIRCGAIVATTALLAILLPLPACRAAGREIDRKITREAGNTPRTAADTTALRDTLRGTGTARPGRLARTAGQERHPDFAGPKRRRLQHRLGAEFRPEYILSLIHI